MLKTIIEKFKIKQKNKEVFDIWQKNITYINNLSKNKVVITHFFNSSSFFILIYLSKKVFFLKKDLDSKFITISGIAHINMINNKQVWECIKYSKSSGNIMDTSSMMLYISEIIQKNKEYFNITYNEERDMWFDICSFINEIETVKVGLPTYTIDENLWVD